MKKLAIITARGGSKRIPKKNIRKFLGKPIIAYSIEAAKNSKLFDEIMVSTDSEEIAKIATNYGANIPFMRSPKNSDDLATTADVILEVLQEYNKRKEYYEYCCCIYPTAPFITANKLIDAFNLLYETKLDSTIPVAKFSYPIWRSFKLENDRLMMNWPEHLNSRSQDLPVAYHDAGLFYFLDSEKFLKNKLLFTDNTAPLILAESEVQDLDTEEDWKIAEFKYAYLNNLIELKKINK